MTDCETCGGEGYIKEPYLPKSIDACPDCAARAETEFQAYIIERGIDHGFADS